MSNREDSDARLARDQWHHAALLATRSPCSPVECPRCQTPSVTAAWHLVDLKAREAEVDLLCSSCNASVNIRIELPLTARGFYPLERMASVSDAVQEQMSAIAGRIRQHARTMPAAAFTTHSLWPEARWSATTFQWHQASEAPPIMGLVFDNADAGKEIFREAERQMNHEDRFEEIRVSIIEGPVPGQEHRPAYSVHICADPEALDAHATAHDFVVDSSIVPFLGQWNRHYPIPGMPAFLPKFKQEFAKHKEFLLAPVTRRADGKLYTDPMLGIIKNIIHFRSLSEITTPDDPDAAALILPQLITPPT
jgi:transcription elongation factor Elf1